MHHTEVGVYYTEHCRTLANKVNWHSGASSSKLTTSLVDVSFKFRTSILQIHCYFLLEKCENLLHCKDSHIFFTKNNSGFENVVGI